MNVIFSYLVGVIAVFCYASLGPMVKKVGFNLPPFTLIACSSLVHLIIAGAVAFFIEKNSVIENIEKIEWKWLLAFSLTNLIGYSLYLWVLTKIPVAEYQIIGVLTPIIGGIFAVWLLQEPFHMRYLLALLFMFIGLYIAIEPALKRGI